MKCISLFCCPRVLNQLVRQVVIQPSVSELCVSDEKLIAAVNTWAEAHDYALIVSRSNKNKREIKNKIWLRCDKNGKPGDTAEQTRLHAGSRLIECFFKAIARELYSTRT